jgi:hypothetical protein
MKTDSPTLAVLAARCQKLAEINSSDVALSSKGFTLYAEWQKLIARASPPLSMQERRKVDADADLLFNRMRNFKVYHTPQLTF